MHGKNLTTWAYFAKNGVKQKNDGGWWRFHDKGIWWSQPRNAKDRDYNILRVPCTKPNRHRQENQGLAAFHKDMSMKLNALFYAMIYLHVSYSYK